MDASRAARWLCGLLFGLLVGIGGAPHVDAQPAAGAFDASRVVQRDGNPTLLVDGRPFFFFGAAFFYERIPAERWRASMLALQTLGVNTLDLYVPWNWHEIRDGDFDFDGHSNPDRNLRALLALAHELGFKLVVRPGPVIRNEWRNGGYPAWLLTRPEYGMPPHDVLEGRYPATATLQNAHSDDAAAQWLANATHLRYASRWLRTVLREFVPYSRDVIAVQLDDDQGAYIDNQTWPAPHFQAYLRTLAAIVRETVGPHLPLFINTYEMKVTASAPVWAMGNWYQSEAYAIGEHDRAALEFSAGLLQTQTGFPLAMSEFQAGWLAAPEDPQPRPADPTNTTLALHTLLGEGMRGTIDFPAQDTRNPPGWEAPFANAAYAWDAALDVDLQPSPRYAPTKAFGDVVRANGAELADSSRLADGAIAYLTSAYDPTRITNADVFAIAARTQDLQHACRLRSLTCDLVDLRFAGDAVLARYAFIVVPSVATGRPFVAAVAERLARYRAHGGRVLAAPPDDVASPRNGGIADATVLFARDGAAFIDVVNYDDRPRSVAATRIDLPDGRRWNVAPFFVAPRDAVLLRFDPLDASTTTTGSVPNVRPVGRPEPPSALPLPSASPGEPVPCRTPFTAALHRDPPFARAAVTVDGCAGDGYPRVTIANSHVAMRVAPDAGGRAFAFAASVGACTTLNVFTSVGALRDDVAIQPPLSTTDRIGKYTRSFPAGMFNRSYNVEPLPAGLAPDSAPAAVTLRYDAPDVVPNGARFERTLALASDATTVEVRERVTFGAGPQAEAQRAVRYDSVDTRDATILDETRDGALGIFYPGAGCAAVVAWPLDDVESAQLLPERTSVVLRLQFVPARTTITRYTIAPAADLAAARAVLMREQQRTLKERAASTANDDDRRGGVAKW